MSPKDAAVDFLAFAARGEVDEAWSRHVAVHSHVVPAPGHRGVVVVHLFRLVQAASPSSGTSGSHGR